MRVGSRRAISALPVSVIFIAMFAASAVGVTALSSNVAHQATTNISVGSLLANRQSQLLGIKPASSGSNDISITNDAGVPVQLVYAIFQTGSNTVKSTPVSYTVQPGQSYVVGLVSVIDSVYGTIPSDLTKVTLVTSLGVYITAGTSLIHQLEKQFNGYSVSQTDPAYWLCNNGVASSSSICSFTYSATATLQFTCPSGFVLVGELCEQHETYKYWVPQTQLESQTYIAGFWEQSYVPGHYITTTSQRTVNTGEQYWGNFCYFPLFFICNNYPLSNEPHFPYVLMYTYMVPIYKTETVTSQEWVPGYATWNFVAGHWVTTYQVTPAHWDSYTTTNYHSENSHTVYACNSGDSLRGQSCEHDYAATYRQSQTVNLGTMSYCPSGDSCSPQYTSYYQNQVSVNSDWVVRG